MAPLDFLEQQVLVLFFGRKKRYTQKQCGSMLHGDDALFMLECEVSEMGG